MRSGDLKRGEHSEKFERGVVQVAGKQAAHENRELCHSRAEKQMEVIGHERPCKAVGAGIGEKLGEALKE